MCKGKNSFGNIDAKDSSISYILNATSSVLAGYLYVVNPYIPIILSTLLSLLTIIISYRFEEEEIKNTKKISISESLKDVKQGYKFIIKSKR